MMLLARFMTIGFCLFLGSVDARAECGDVTGDGTVTSNDALRTLRRAVGQNVAMDCSEVDPPANALAFSNRVTCNSSDPHAKLTWSEHPSLDWQTNLSTKFPSLSSDYERVDDLVMGGTLTATFGACGAVSLNLNDKLVAFLLPNHAGAIVTTDYQASDEIVYFTLSIAPVSTNSATLLSSEEAPASALLGSVPAPKGLSGVLE